MIYSQYELEIWQRLLSYINNEYGVAALMGNLYAESSLFPGRLQNDFTTGYTPSRQYTDLLNNGTVTEYNFVNKIYSPYGLGSYGPAYGLAQWDYFGRRQNYWNEWHSRGAQAGSVSFETDFVWWELNTSEFSAVRNALINAANVRSASDVVLRIFENPADQSEAVQRLRASYGQALYDEYHGGQPPTPTTTIPVWLLFKIRKEQFKNGNITSV